jgi:hypothetical protein
VAVSREQGRKEEQVKQIHFWQRLLHPAEIPAEQLLALSLEELDRLIQQLQAEGIQSLARPS